MITRNYVTKKDIVSDAYLNALIFLWINSDTETEVGQKCKAMFDDYADILWKMDERFEGTNFSSPENQAIVVDDLEKLYYFIVDVDPASDTLLLMCADIDMIDDAVPIARKCRR